MKNKIMKNFIMKSTIYVEYISSHSGGESLSDDKWSSREDEYIDFDITKCATDKSLVGYSREEHEVNFKPEPGKVVYVVYVRYSTGDSFGRTSGAWKIIEIFESIDDAKALKESIDSKEYEKDNYVAWVGYFETFQSSHIEAFVLV